MDDLDLVEINQGFQHLPTHHLDLGLDQAPVQLWRTEEEIRSSVDGRKGSTSQRHNGTTASRLYRVLLHIAPFELMF